MSKTIKKRQNKNSKATAVDIEFLLNKPEKTISVWVYKLGPEGQDPFGNKQYEYAIVSNWVKYPVTVLVSFSFALLAIFYKIHIMKLHNPFLIGCKISLEWNVRCVIRTHSKRSTRWKCYDGWKTKASSTALSGHLICCSRPAIPRVRSAKSVQLA